MLIWGNPCPYFTTSESILQSGRNATSTDIKNGMQKNENIVKQLMIFEDAQTLKIFIFSTHPSFILSVFYLELPDIIKHFPEGRSHQSGDLCSIGRP